MRMFAARPGETVTIKVTEITEEDGKAAGGIPVFEVKDQNHDKTLETLSIRKGKEKSWTNDTGHECIVKISANVEWAGTRVIKIEYKVAPK